MAAPTHTDTPAGLTLTAEQVDQITRVYRALQAAIDDDPVATRVLALTYQLGVLIGVERRAEPRTVVSSTRVTR